MGGNDNLVFNFYGALFEEGQKGFSLRTLSAMLSMLGLSAEASRLALSRMARRGYLRTRRKGRSSYYFLTEEGLALVRQGEERSVSRGEPCPWDGRMHMVSYELPETLRGERAELAATLRRAGYGRAAAGLWAYAYEPPESIKKYLARPELRGRVEEYRARHEGDTRAFARRIWRLEECRIPLDSFLERYTRARSEYLARSVRGDAPGAAECFAAYFGVLSDFVPAMASVPPVPSELLPDDWPARQAAALFSEYFRLVRDGAQTYFLSIYEPF